jgi:two-component system, OmpR family, sensor histidine kinase ChvG
MTSPSLYERLFLSLSARILAVNILALVMLAGGILYLDSFRSKLIGQRRNQMIEQTMMVARALSLVAPDDQSRLMLSLGTARGVPRLQLYDGARLLADTRMPQGALLVTRPLAENGRIVWQGVRERSARALDLILEWLAGAPHLDDFIEPQSHSIQSFAEVKAARRGVLSSALRRRVDGVIVISVAAPLGAGPDRKLLLLTSDTRDLVKLVRRERLTSFQLFCMTLAMTLLLSIFLSRTIARPLRRLAIAAERVRLGRGRDVTIPRFMDRRDEVGELSRALSDMTQTLHQRMDATESFAADVAHELKNPLASMRGAVEILRRGHDEPTQKRMLEIVQHDMQRMQRLITDISESSRLDAELSREQMREVDLRAMVTTLAEVYAQMAEHLHFVTDIGPAVPKVTGQEWRLGQVLRNIIDNAVSFSPPGGTITIGLHGDQQRVHLTVDDEGPGIPEANLRDIFKRFYSERPSSESFGGHSGLGLAIARQIVEAHGGQLAACNRANGARFTLTLPTV